MQNIYNMQQFRQAVGRLVTTHGLPFAVGPQRPNKEITVTISGIHNFYLYPTNVALKQLSDEMVLKNKNHLLFVEGRNVIVTPSTGKYAPHEELVVEEGELSEIDKMKREIEEEIPAQVVSDEVETEHKEILEGEMIGVTSIEGNPEAIEPLKEDELTEEAAEYKLPEVSEEQTVEKTEDEKESKTITEPSKNNTTPQKRARPNRRNKR